MRDNQDIKDQLRKIKNLISESNPITKSHISEIKKQYLICHYILKLLLFLLVNYDRIYLKLILFLISNITNMK